MNMIGIYALSLLLQHQLPSVDLIHMTLQRVVVLLQLSLVMISGFSAYRCGGMADPKHSRFIWMAWTLLVTVTFAVACDLYLWQVIAPSARTLGERNFFFYRAVYPLSGASPTLPLMLLLAALIVWMKGRLAKLVFYDYRIPRLPGVDTDDDTKTVSFLEKKTELRCPSQNRVERLNQFLNGHVFRSKRHKRTWNVQKLCLAAISISLVVVALKLSGVWGPYSLAYGHFDQLIDLLAGIVAAAILQDLLVSWRAWRMLREEVLMPLKQSPLRWGFNWIRGFSWKRLWTTPDGLSPEAQLEYVIRNVEADNREAAQESRGHGNHDVVAQYKNLLRQYEGRHCLKWRHEKRWKDAGKLESEWADGLAKQLKLLYEALAVESTMRLARLSRLWRKDAGPLTGPEAERGYPNGKKPEAPETLQRMADEEFVAMVYLSYIRSVLVQIRNRIATSATLYILLLWALTCYPWMNRHSIFLLMSCLLVFLGVVAITIYSEMQRDDILSRTTSTAPGKLDGEFFAKILSVVGIPLLTLIASQFPEFSNAIFSWLEPGLSSFHG